MTNATLSTTPLPDAVKSHVRLEDSEKSLRRSRGAAYLRYKSSFAFALVCVCASLGLSAFAVSPPSGAYLTYRPPGNLSIYPWDELSSWDTTISDAPATHLPTLTNNVFLYSSKNAIDKKSLTGKPMVVSDGVHAETAKLFIGDENNYLIGLRIASGGTITNAATVYAGAGQNGASTASGSQGAWLEIENGGSWTALDSFYLGLSKDTSWLTVKEGGILTCANEFVVGQAYGSAIVTNAGTMVIQNFFIGGTKSSGRMEVTGTLKVASKFTIGRHNNSTAYLHIASGGRLEKTYVASKPVYIGNASNCTATVELDSDFTLADNDNISVGNQSFCTGRLIIGPGATVSNVHYVQLGPAKSSDGTLELRGGTLCVKGSSVIGTQRIFLGNRTTKGNETRGRIVGYGAVRSSNGNSLRVQPYGQFIADGNGDRLDLNLADIRTIGTNANDNVNGCHTNGWFAVNKGRLIYPRSQNCTINTTSHPTIGDYPNRTMPTMMNSFRYTLTTAPSDGTEYFNYAELYATDRDDIPAGLPTGRSVTVAGVWRFGLSKAFTWNSAPTPISFGGMKVSFRYDDRNMKPGQQVSVYHHDGSANGSWRKISAEQPAFTSPTERSDNMITTTTALDSSDETWNAGWFAVVADGRKGLFVVIK